MVSDAARSAGRPPVPLAGPGLGMSGAQRGAPGSKEEQKAEWRVWTAQPGLGREWGEDRERFLEIFVRMV